MSRKLLTEDVLESSAVVANCRMNRERGIVGTNSYEADLFLNPLDFLNERLLWEQEVAWLDLCCGTGKALLQSALYFQRLDLANRVVIQGVDLVEMFDEMPEELSNVTLEASSLRAWMPKMPYDLITCVHGLHYVGDKLGLIERAVSWLKPKGLFLGHLDLSNVKLLSGHWIGGQLGKHFKKVGLEYNRSRRLLSCHRIKNLEFPWKFVGADDSSGPNFTGQPAVDSYYAEP